MASIAGLRPWPRWRWTWFWQRSTTTVGHAEDAAAGRPELRSRRHYPPQRDRFMESSAMAREMYRL
ncbi:hypothetical protein ACTWP6_12910 [Mycobacterium sp. 4D054]|uniref:hypothetical protein n=1 Tax=unclassified Mycobacterium TaxID=2642494 RepID=UPI0021B1FC22|nr:hypothetical protein [Mycobacterium sp. SMC-8]UXA14433.1 hypothetical protein KXD97_11970 [Mycobacterium sp. SMC-8]